MKLYEETIETVHDAETEELRRHEEETKRTFIREDGSNDLTRSRISRILTWSRISFENAVFALRVLFKWILFGTLTGIVVGLAATLFYFALEFATDTRTAYPWIIFGLPLGGLLIAGLYHFLKNDLGTNVVIASVHREERIPLRMAPMIFIATFLTHLFGASAGREGAALQLGGSISACLGRLLRVDKHDMHIVIMCGMSAGFSALFGTPLAASIFSIEMISVGIMHYSALVPCVFASIIANFVSTSLGTVGESFHLSIIPDFTVPYFIKMIFFSICFGVLAAAFCQMMKLAHLAYKKCFPNRFLRIAMAGVIIVVLTCILQTTDYMGAGMNIIEESFSEAAKPEAFFLKMLFTCLALGAGYKGGEIVPSFFIGATFGSFFGPLVGLPMSLSAACGMLGVFCGVTNCPVTALFIGFELFGFDAMPYFLVAVSVSYMTSGYHGLYKEQKLVYSKYQTRFINRNPD